MSQKVERGFRLIFYAIRRKQCSEEQLIDALKKIDELQVIINNQLLKSSKIKRKKK